MTNDEIIAKASSELDELTARVGAELDRVFDARLEQNARLMAADGVEIDEIAAVTRVHRRTLRPWRDAAAEVLAERLLEIREHDRAPAVH